MNAKLTPIKVKPVQVCLAVCLFITGCATGPKKTDGYLFYPAPPDKPRIQFLMGFASETDLKPRSSFSNFVLGEEQTVRPIWKPYGISTRPGKMYVADTQGKNVIFIDLETKGSFSYLRPAGAAAIKTPISAVVDADGNCFVSDSARGQVLIYDQNKSFVGAIGQPEELKPAGMALAGDRLYVCDLKHHCVSVYDRVSRAKVGSFPSDPADEKGRLFSPTNVAVDKNGRVIVADTGAYMVQVYAADGSHLRSIGEQGLKPGRFSMVKGVAVDREGRIYAVDSATAVVQVFNAEGELLMFFGLPAASGSGGLHLPAGICIDYDNTTFFEKYAAPGKKLEFLIHVVSQAGLQRVGVYGFLKQD